MDTETLIRTAIANQNAVGFDTPSEATIVQLREFANAGDYDAFARLFVAHRTAFPTTRRFMEGHVKALIRSGLGRDFDARSRLARYERENQDFISNAYKAVQNPGYFVLFMQETQRLIDDVARS
ncbi:hypothetical protein [Rhizobium anhuiense]